MTENPWLIAVINMTIVFWCVDHPWNPDESDLLDRSDKKKEKRSLRKLPSQ